MSADDRQLLTLDLTRQFGLGEAAPGLARGVCRLLDAMGYTPLCEVPLGVGRRADVLALSGKGRFAIVEIKSGLADFRADQKWPDYVAHCDRFYFAVGADFPREVLPPHTGLLIADRYGAELRPRSTPCRHGDGFAAPPSGSLWPHRRQSAALFV